MHSSSENEISRLKTEKQNKAEEQRKLASQPTLLAQLASKDQRDRARPTERTSRPQPQPQPITTHATHGYAPLLHETVQLHTLPHLKQLLDKTFNAAGQDGSSQLTARLIYEIGPPRDSTLRYPHMLPTQIDELLLSSQPLLGQADTHLLLIDKAVFGKDVPHGIAIKAEALIELQERLLIRPGKV